MNEQELREQIAQEIEKWTASIVKVEGGIKLHPDCWKCGTEVITIDCENARKHEMKSAFQIAAKIARGNK